MVKPTQFRVDLVLHPRELPQTRSLNPILRSSSAFRAASIRAISASLEFKFWDPDFRVQLERNTGNTKSSKPPLLLKHEVQQRLLSRVDLVATRTLEAPQLGSQRRLDF